MNIIVITFYTSNYVIGKDTEKINQSYCEFNNYDFNCYNIIPGILKSRHPAWCKLYYLLEIMKDEIYDYIMWIDADAFFCNKELKIEDWINKSNNKNIIISRDPGYTYDHYIENPEKLNSGVMIFRNCDKNKNLLNYILYDIIFEPNYNVVRSYNKNIKFKGWDQAAIRYSFLNNEYMKKNTWVNLDTNFNNNTNNIKEYISNGGFIIHLTNFKDEFINRNKNLKSIKEFYNLNKKLININILHGTSCIGKSYKLITYNKDKKYKRIEMDDYEYWLKKKPVELCINKLLFNIENNENEENILITSGWLPLLPDKIYENIENIYNIKFYHILILYNDIDTYKKRIIKRKRDFMMEDLLIYHKMIEQNSNLYDNIIYN